MFVGREEELDELHRLYSRPGFQMVVLYGRRRVGKTTLIDRFVKGKKALYFTGKQQSSLLNLAEFSEKVYGCFDIPNSLPAFRTWSDALSFISKSCGSERLVFVFDELPYAAQTEPSLPSVLQVAIDHGFKQSNVFMVLCGSNERFMESEVLGSKSPLYGRRTAQIHLEPFDYLDAAKMISGASHEDQVRYYATFGGTPYYLEQIDAAAPYQENIANIIFNRMGLLFEEPQMLLRQELRELALYNSVMHAIASGATVPLRIADAAGIKQSSISKYLATLTDLGLIERRIPFGEDPRRKGIYKIKDPFFSFWYRFVGPVSEAIDMGNGPAIARELSSGQALTTYEGSVFETVCAQWIARQNRKQLLPFTVLAAGSWWGPDPQLREQVDVDLVAANREQHRLLCGECKWRNSFNEQETLAALQHRSALVPGRWKKIYLYLFTKRPVQDATRSSWSSNDSVRLVSADEMF